MCRNRTYSNWPPHTCRARVLYSSSCRIYPHTTAEGGARQKRWAKKTKNEGLECLHPFNRWDSITFKAGVVKRSSSDTSWLVSFGRIGWIVDAQRYVGQSFFVGGFHRWHWFSKNVHVRPETKANIQQTNATNENHLKSQDALIATGWYDRTLFRLGQDETRSLGGFPNSFT